MLGHHGIGEQPLAAVHVSAESVHIVDSIAYAETLSDEPLNILHSRIAYGITASQQMTAAHAVLDQVAMDDLTSAFWSMALSDQVDFTDPLVPTAFAVTALADALVVTGAASSTLQALGMLADVFALDDDIRSVYDADLADGIAFDDAASHLLRALASLTDTAALGDTATPRALCSIPLTDTVAIDDTPVTTAAVANALRDGLPLFVTLNIDGGTFSGFAMNTANKAVSDYSNWPFESFAKVGNRYYGAKADGIYLLEGDDDAGDAIAARVRTALMNLLGGKMARVPEAYVGYSGDGQLVMKVITTGKTGEKDEFWYAMVEQNANAMREGRFKFGRGLKSVYWQFELCNKDGADFDLDNIKLHRLELDRRI